MKFSSALRVAAVVSLLVLLPGCTRTINRSAERRIRDALPGYIGPAREWRAHVDNPADRTLRGRLSRVTIDGDGVQLRQTIVCESLHIEMRDVVVETGSNRLRSVGETTFTAVIGEAELNAYLRATPPPPDEPTRVKRVLLREGRMTAEATRWMLGREWPYTLVVEPRLASPTLLKFDPDKMSVLGLKVPLPASVLRWFARRLDQGFDFSTLPFPLRISSFQVERGRIILSGTADVMQSLNERIALELRGRKSIGAACWAESVVRKRLPGGEAMN
jgi:hypothetical protein